MLKLLCFFGSFLLLAGCKSPNAPGDPAARLQAFLSAYSKGDIGEIRTFILDPRPSKLVDRIFKNPTPKVDAKITNVSILGTEARVKFDSTVEGQTHLGEVAYLKYAGGNWYLDRNPDQVGKHPDGFNSIISLIKTGSGPG